MKNFRVLVAIIVVVLLVFSNQVVAQNEVTYKKRIEQIDEEFAKKLGYKNLNDRDAQVAVASAIIQGMTDCGLGKDTKYSRLYIWYEKERKAAEKLKIAEEKYKNSDYYIITESIKKRFEQWSKKGEFESTTSYDERIKKQSVDNFYMICSDEVSTYISKFNIDAQLQPYDADNQYFPVKIFFFHSRESYGTISIPVPIGEASDFKSKYSNYFGEGNVDDLVFVENNFAFTKVSYEGREFNVPIKNSKEVTFAFKDLGIQNPYCHNAVFNLNMVKKIKEEQQRSDSIACVEYNYKLDSIVSIYNQKLLQEEYNLKKKIIEASTIECGKGVEESYADEKHDIEEKYNSLISYFEKYKSSVDCFKQECSDAIETFIFEDEDNVNVRENCPCLSKFFRGFFGDYVCKGNIYYKEVEDKIKEFIVDINPQLSNEWNKYGQYFESKVDFFKTYVKFIWDSYNHLVVINPEYEKILYGKMPESERQRYDSIVCIEYNHKLDSIITAYNKELLQNEYNFGKKTVGARNLECGQGIGKRFRDAKKDVDNKFNFIKDAAEKAKQRIQDSIVCAGYNKQLDSIVVEYNQKLLQEEYNFENRTIENPQLEPGQGIEKRFSDAKSKISNNFNSIMAVADRNKKTIENYKQTYSDNIKDLAFKMFNSSDWHAYNNCPDYLMDNIVTGSRDLSYSNELVEKLIEYTVDTNTQLSKEWAKNGQYFDNKADFFNSYLKFDHYHKYVGLNPEYKTILKEKKKTKK